ncbi:hypothetical protein [Fusobacterium sp. PH5-44]|uniref:hypothetical protein n=1 Tax=unclassified Fusobacterium TaxID=2648384 RepID=UPI003D24F533
MSLYILIFFIFIFTIYILIFFHKRENEYEKIDKSIFTERNEFIYNDNSDYIKCLDIIDKKRKKNFSSKKILVLSKDKIDRFKKAIESSEDFELEISDSRIINLTFNELYYSVSKLLCTEEIENEILNESNRKLEFFYENSKKKVLLEKQKDIIYHMYIYYEHGTLMYEYFIKSESTSVLVEYNQYGEELRKMRFDDIWYRAMIKKYAGKIPCYLVDFLIIHILLNIIDIDEIVNKNNAERKCELILDV